MFRISWWVLWRRIHRLLRKRAMYGLPEIRKYDGEYRHEKEDKIMVKQTAGRDQLGDFAPKFAQLNDDVLFGEVWNLSLIHI